MTVALRAPGPHAARLSPPALARLRRRLADQMRASAEQAAAHDATARQLAGHTDPDSAIERELAVACAARAREAIEDVRDALDRLELGIYGVCAMCGAPIPVERLEVIPHARLCVACPGEHAADSDARSARLPRRLGPRMSAR